MLVASTLDFIVLCAYLIAVLAVGVFVSRREHLEGYLTNNRKTRITMLTLSTIASVIGAGAVVGVSSAAYTTGISYGLVVLLSLVVGTLIFAWLAPKIKAFGDSQKAHTVGDFFNYRFGGSSRTIFAIFYLLSAFIWSSIQFVAIAQLIKILIGIRFEFALIMSVAITIFYTSLGGIISDMVTDVLQFWVMLAMFLFLIPIAWVKAGGFTALSSLPASSFNPLSFGGWSFFIGGIFLSGIVIIPEVEYWQKLYSSDSKETAKNSQFWSLPGVVFFVICSILAGLLAVKLAPGVNPDTALFTMMNNILPSGLLGLAYAGIIALAMSSVDSLLLAGASTILKDLYMPFAHPKMHEHELLNMARYLTAIFGVFAAIIAFFFQDIVKLSLLGAFTAGCLVFPIIGGFVWKRATKKASIASMIVALIITYALSPFMPEIAGIPGFLIGCVVFVIGSLLTNHSPSEHVL